MSFLNLPRLTSHLPCSAGGTGVLLNVDRVAEQLEELGYPAIQVRGLADSGWFLDNKQYRRTDCIDTITCAPTEAIRRGIRCPGREGPFCAEGLGLGGIRGWRSSWGLGGSGESSLTCSVWPRYWNGVVPERCRRQFKEGEEWNCFFGYKVYPTLRCEWERRVEWGVGFGDGCPAFLCLLETQPGVQSLEARLRDHCHTQEGLTKSSEPGQDFLSFSTKRPLSSKQTRMVGYADHTHGEERALELNPSAVPAWGLGCPSPAPRSKQHNRHVLVKAESWEPGQGGRRERGTSSRQRARGTSRQHSAARAWLACEPAVDLAVASAPGAWGGGQSSEARPS